uniref:PH domain-containing protein n=1 Tax=Chrysotila carterae TaxID=13221 RepID=A0A7S4F479_CHRCT
MGRDVEVEPRLLAILKGGAYFYKHDFGRVKRTRKWAILSSDGLALRWRSVGPTEVVMAGDGGSTARGNTTSRGLMRSSSFSRFTTSAHSHVEETAGAGCVQSRGVERLTRSASLSHTKTRFWHRRGTTRKHVGSVAVKGDVGQVQSEC